MILCFAEISFQQSLLMDRRVGNRPLMISVLQLAASLQQIRNLMIECLVDSFDGDLKHGSTLKMHGEILDGIFLDKN